MSRIPAFIFLLLITGISLQAQYSRYIIKLKDKAGSNYSINNPGAFLSSRAIDRRAKYSIPVTESDLPVNQWYIDSIQEAGAVTILNVSKWFNKVCIQTTDAAALDKINHLTFVENANPIALRPANPLTPVNKKLDTATAVIEPMLQRPMQPQADFYDYGLAYPQIRLHNAEFLHNLGFRGKNMQVAITDAGFSGYASLTTFDSVRTNNQILATWDYVLQRENVNAASVHGMQCFSTMAANLPGKFIGTSPEASFYLYRTEDASTEYPVEEQNWVAAAERADSAGADLISISLGYNTFDISSFNHSYADLNGHTTIIAKGVNVAVEKGIMVVASAGNDGNNQWHYIATPADADSVIAVGAVNANGQIAGFSSYGPSADGQVKPTIAAVGAGAVIASSATGLPAYGNGTSFACPIMAGILTCIKQAYPEINNAVITDALVKSADKYLNPDDRTGYGIPDVKKTFVLLQQKTFSWENKSIVNCIANLSFRVKIAEGMQVLVEKKLPGNDNFFPADTLSSNAVFSNQQFNYTDNLDTLEAGVTVQYRLRLDISTDTSFYLDSVLLTLQKSCKILEEKIIITPNPVQNNANVLVQKNNATRVKLAVYNSLGQKIYQLPEQTVSGAQTFTLPSAKWRAGVYYVLVWLDDKKQSVKKIIKQ